MKTLIAAAALAALLPAAALAQSQEVRQERRVIVAGPGMHMEIGEDGLTREQFMARHTEMFARMDADGDGRVTREEMRAHHETMMSEHGGRMGMMMMRPGDGHGAHHGPGSVMVMRHGDGDGERRMRVFEMRHDGPGLDADGDGRISLEELTAPLRRHFQEMDADGSGYLEAGERGHMGHHRE